MSVKIKAGSISAVIDDMGTRKDIGILVADERSVINTLGDDFNKAFKLGVAKPILDANTAFVNSFINTLLSYKNARYTGSGSGVRWSYGSNTPTKDNADSNEIDCSYFVLQGIRGIAFDESLYSRPGDLITDIGGVDLDTGDDYSGIEDISDGDASEPTGSGYGRPLWSLDPDTYLRKKERDSEPTVVRTASQMLDWMEDLGWSIDFNPSLSTIQRGDIVFWAKKVTQKRMAIRMVDWYFRKNPELKPSDNELESMSLEALIEILKEFDSKISTNDDILEAGMKLGISPYLQPNRYRHVSHVAVVVNTYDNNDPSKDVDSFYKYRHTLLEATTNSPFVLNTTLEKRQPDQIVAVCRPQWKAWRQQAPEPLNGSLTLSGNFQLNTLYYPGLYYLTDSCVVGLPDGVANGYGMCCEVQATYREKNKPYMILQKLYDTKSGDIWCRAQCTDTNVEVYVPESSKWTPWRKVN